jgi:hypothetical protein
MPGIPGMSGIVVGELGLSEDELGLSEGAAAAPDTSLTRAPA